MLQGMKGKKDFIERKGAGGVVGCGEIKEAQRKKHHKTTMTKTGKR